MTKKALIAVIALVFVLLMIGILAAAVRKNGNTAEETASSEEELAKMVIVPSEMPVNISLPIPGGFSETSSPYYDKYYVMNDASIIVTGEKLAIPGQSLDDYALSMQRQYEKTADDYTLLSLGDVKSGAPCKLLEFTYALIGEDVRQDFQCITAVLMKDDYVYIVTCKSKKENFASYRGAFLSMIGKITISDAEAPAQNGADGFTTSPADIPVPSEIGADSSEIAP